MSKKMQKHSNTHSSYRKEMGDILTLVLKSTNRTRKKKTTNYEENKQ